MGDQNDEDLADILSHIGIQPSLPVDLSLASQEAVRFLSAVATYINTLAVGEYVGRQGPVREAGLLEQVVGAALQTFADVDPHPSPFDKAAMLLRGVTAGHPFQDGNKRTGFLLAAFFLEHLGFPIPDPLSVDDAERLCLRISSGTLRNVDQIARELNQLWQRG